MNDNGKVDVLFPVVGRVQRGGAPHDPLYATLLPGITEMDVSPGDPLALYCEEGRAAVAELIAADQEYDAASEAWYAVPGPPDGCVDDRDYNSAEYRRLCDAIERRRAALSRITEPQA